jgi:hypothetical protein
VLGISGGLYFLFFLSAILLLVRWCIAKDSGRQETLAPGLFDMVEADQGRGRQARPIKRRTRLTRVD